MPEALVYRHTATFNATPEQVWDVLVNPAKVKAYMFGCDIETTWEVGSPLLWYLTGEDGNKLLMVKGDITRFEPNKVLGYTLFPPTMPIEDIPENYLDAVFSIEATADGALLHIEQTGFERAAMGQQRYDETAKGWDVIIDAMRAQV